MVMMALCNILNVSGYTGKLGVTGAALCADIAIGPNLMFATRLGGKFKEFPALAKYVAKLKVRCTLLHACCFIKSYVP